MKAEDWVPAGIWVSDTHQIEWSGITAIYICPVCGEQGGITLSIAETKSEAKKHRADMHPDFRPGFTRTICRTCNRMRARSYGLCHGCIAAARKTATKELENA